MIIFDGFMVIDGSIRGSIDVLLIKIKV